MSAYLQVGRTLRGSGQACPSVGCGYSDRHPDGIVGIPGYVWLDMPGKVRGVGEQEREFTEEPPDF
jgi:hypothetical protein